MGSMLVFHQKNYTLTSSNYALALVYNTVRAGFTPAVPGPWLWYV